MTDQSELLRSLRAAVGSEVELHAEGPDRYRVFTPFTFDDGDEFALVYKRSSNGWVLTDEGHTLLHLSYWMEEGDLETGTRRQVIDNAIASVGLRERAGRFEIDADPHDAGGALFAMLQGLTKVTAASYLDRELVASTFMEDLAEVISSRFDSQRVSQNWCDPRDPQGLYPVDFRINGVPRPLFVFGLASDTRVQDATITIQRFEQWQLPFTSVGVFERQEDVARRALARFSDVADKQFSALLGNEDRLLGFLEREIERQERPTR